MPLGQERVSAHEVDRSKPSDRERANRITTREYDRISGVWDRSFVEATNAMRERLLDLAALRPGERVLDVGTGTGATALLAAPKVGPTGSVLGIDISREMLAKARAKAAEQRMANVEFRLMDAASLELPDASFDAVIGSYGAPNAVDDDAVAVFREWYRVLSAGGRLCFCEWYGSPEGEDKPVGLLAKYRVAKPGPELAARRRLRARMKEERERLPLISARDPPQVKHSMGEAGFRDARTSTRKTAVTFPSAHEILNLMLLWWDYTDEYAAMPPSARTDFRTELSQELQRFETPEGVRFPGKTVFFLATKAGS